MKIKILHTIDTTGPGGAETVFVNLVNRLDPQRFVSFAVIRGPGWVCDTLRKNGIEPLFVQSKGGFNFCYLKKLVRIIREQRIDIIQSHLLGSNLYSCMAGLICGIPVISTFHGFVDSSDMDRFILFKSRLINLGSSKIVFVSDHLREHYQTKFGFSLEKSVTIYNGVDTNRFYRKKDSSIKQKLGLGEEHILIGAVGNIRPAKGYDLFLLAARIVFDKHPECRFVVAGQASGELYEKLLRLRKELNLEDVLFFLGFREDTDIVLNNLDIYVLPSVSEGFSLSTIEAMACGLPVVVTLSGGPNEIVKDNDNGFIVERDEKSISKALIKIIKSNIARESFSVSAIDSITTKFSISMTIKQYDKLISTCVNN